MNKMKHNRVLVYCIAGFSLIELMIVVAIIGIISAVAYPSYVEYIVRTNRADAADAINEVLFEQERYQLRRRQYSTDLSDLGYSGSTFQTERGLYTISAENCTGETNANNCIQVRAAPVADSIQGKNGEAALTLNSRGEKTGKWED